MARLSPASGQYIARAKEIERWLARRLEDGTWTATDWELLGAQTLLLRAAAAETEHAQLVDQARLQGVGPVDDVGDLRGPEEDTIEDRAGCLLAIVLLVVAFVAGLALGLWIGRV
jgi:hypothetical protein